MIFASALFALKRGHKIKRKHWTGYWCLNAVDSNKPSVEMHCWDGKVVNLQETDDILYTLENIACDDWEIVEEGYHATKEVIK